MLVHGLKIIAISLGLTVLLTVLAILLISAGIAQMLSGLPSATPSQATPGQAPTGDQLTSAFLIVLGFFFFTAHLAPYGGDFSVASFNAFGVGALLITFVVVVVSYRTGRQLQRLFPDSGSNGEAGLRAAALVVPYWLVCLVLFLTSSLHAQSPYFGNISLGPSPLGLVTPLVLVSGSSVVGAIRERAQPLSPSSVFAIRGAVLALFSIGLGILGSLIGAIVALVAALASHSSAFQPATSPSSSGSFVPSAPATSSTATSSTGPLVVLLGIAVAVFYLPNGLLWLWGTALGLNVSSAGWLIFVFGMLGALVGALTVRPRTGRTEQISYAVTFALASSLLTLISRPAIGAYAWGGNPWVVLIVGLILGTVLAVVGPLLATTGLGRRVLALPVLPFALARIPLPSLDRAPLQPNEQAPSSAAVISVPPAVQVQMPVIHFGKRARIAGAIVVVLIVAAVAGNIYASSMTTPEASATAYVDAVGTNNADAIWSHTTVILPQQQNPLFANPAAPNTPELTSKVDLKAMLAIPENSHQARSGISVTNSTVSGDNAMVAVSYTEQGQRRTETLHLIRDRGQSQFVFYPTWKVEMPAGFIFMNLPTNDSQIAIDGASLQGGSNVVIVLPGSHRVTLLASGPFASSDQVVTVQAGAQNTVAFQNVRLSQVGQSAAQQALQSYFAACAQQTGAYAGNCPQQLSAYVTSPITWKLIGDPTKDASLSVDPNSHAVLAVGHFLMTAQYATDSGTLHRVSGGPYALALVWSGSAFSVQGPSYFAGQANALTDPGAASATILAVVKAGWDACLKATTFQPPDCPFNGFSQSATDVKWTSSDDPLSRAEVTWDGSVGIYRVTSTFTVTVSYTISNSSDQQSFNGTFAAEVIWDGQKATLIDMQ